MTCPLGSRCRWWRWVVTFATFGQYFFTLGLLFNFSILFVSLQKDFNSSSALTGMLVFSRVLTALITHYGWRNALGILSGGILVFGIADGLLLADPPPTEGYATAPDESPDEEKCELESMVQGKQVDEDGCVEETDDEAHNTDGKTTNNEKANISEAVGVERQFRQRLVSALTSAEAWAWYLCVLLSYTGGTFFNLNYASLLDGLGLDSSRIAWVIMCFALAEFGGKVLIALIGDHLPFLYLYLLIASCLLETVVLGLLTVAKTFGIMVLLAFGCVQFLVSCDRVSTQHSVSAAQLFHEQYGTKLVMVMTFVPNGVGNLISAPIAGVLYDVTGDYVLSLLVIADIFFCASAAGVFIPLRKKFRPRAATRSSPPSVDVISM